LEINQAAAPGMGEGMTPSEIAREILTAFGNRPDAAYSIEADLWLFERIKAALSEQRKEKTCNCGSNNCLVNIHGVETPICNRPGHHAPFCGCGEKSKK